MTNKKNNSMKQTNAKQEEWISGNRLIAEFMGGKYIHKYGFKDQMGYEFLKPPKSGELEEVATWYRESDGLQYNTSWDWLMPVVEKIPTLNPDKGRLWFEFDISRCHCRIYTNLGEEWKNNGGTTLEATWKTVNDFITWYNSNTK